MRGEEVCSLEWSKVSLDGKDLSVRAPLIN